MEENDQIVIRGRCPNGCYTKGHDKCAGQYDGFWQACCGLGSCLTLVIPCTYPAQLLGVVFCPVNCAIAIAAGRHLENDAPEAERLREVLRYDYCGTVTLARGTEMCCTPCCASKDAYRIIAGEGGRHC